MGASESWFTMTSVTVDQVLTFPLVQTWITATFIMVNLTVATCSSSRTSTLISIDKISTASPMLTRIRDTFVNLLVTEPALVAAMATAHEVANKIYAGTMDTGDTYTVIDVDFTFVTSVPYST